MFLTSISTISFPGLGLEMNPSRVAFSIAGWNFYWYGIIIAAGFLLAVIYALKYIESVGISRDELIDFLLIVTPVAIIGARAYYVLNNLSAYEDDFTDVFRVWEGGLAIYGAVIAAVITALIYCRIKKLRVGALLDIGCIGLFIGQCIGRWGNFINREAHGTVTSLPWRMGLTYSTGVTTYVHPTFLYESLWNLVGFLIAHFIIRPRRKYDSQIFVFYIGWYGLGRFMIEGLRTDSLYLLNTNLRVSQLVAGVSVLAAVLLIIYHHVFKNHEPEELFVNARPAMAAAAAAAATAVEPESADESEEEYEYEEESLFEYDGPLTGDKIEYNEGDYVVEPIDVVLYDENEQ